MLLVYSLFQRGTYWNKFIKVVSNRHFNKSSNHLSYNWLDHKRCVKHIKYHVINSFTAVTAKHNSMKIFWLFCVETLSIQGYEIILVKINEFRNTVKKSLILVCSIVFVISVISNLTRNIWDRITIQRTIEKFLVLCPVHLRPWYVYL